jgi:hypothetical protein
VNNAERAKRQQDLIFQEIEEKKRLADQANAATERAMKHLGSWFREEYTRSCMRKKFFRAMSKEQQQAFVDDAIREWKRRNPPTIQT